MGKFKWLGRDKSLSPVRQGILTGILEVCYIVMVALFMICAGAFIDGRNPTALREVISAASMLTLLVLSVGMSGALVFGWPAHYWMERKYDQALQAFAATIATIFVLCVTIFLLAFLASIII